MHTHIHTSHLENFESKSTKAKWFVHKRQVTERRKVKLSKLKSEKRNKKKLEKVKKLL